MPSARDSLRFAFLPFAALLTLSGCGLSEMVFGKKTDYRLEGEIEDPALNDYLDAVLKDEVEARTTDLSENPAVLKRQEEYLEKLVETSLLKGLRAKGYYDAAVAYRDGEEEFSGAYAISPGPLYTIADLRAVPDAFTVNLPVNTPEPGEALDAVNILRAQGELYKNVQQDRCYFSMDVRNEVMLLEATHRADVRFLVEAGPEGSFGPVTFEGSENVREDYLRKLIPWKQGDCFRKEKIEEFKTSLLQSGLFSTADAVLPEAPGDDGRVPVRFVLKERAARTVSAGATYYSDEGPGVTFGWKHRNLLGAAETLDMQLTLSQLRQSLDTNFTKPYFLRKDQNLSITSSLRRQDTDAFDELGADIGASIGRNFSDHLSASTGTRLSFTRIDDKTERSSDLFGLLSFPQNVTYDNRDNRLDARKGYWLTGGVEPFFDVLGTASPFLKTSATASSYLALGTPLDLVLAGKAGIGSILGSETADIPATQRFYSGGGGSVRGFGFQEVGPKDEDGDPTGGRSLVNASFEMRSKFTKSVGGVAFVDAGNVSENISPSLDDLAVGAGLGVRYFTSFGPIRFDVAVPLTQKEDIDQNYQFYISIGQSF
jgi:translocation and assembly module TamA